jgi:hypothetical protein
VRRHLGWVLGLALVAAGIVLQATQGDFAVVMFGVDQDLYRDGFVLLTHRDLVGIGLTVAGCLILAGWGGYVLGRRRRPKGQGSDT